MHPGRRAPHPVHVGHDRVPEGRVAHPSRDVRRRVLLGSAHGPANRRPVPQRPAVLPCRGQHALGPGRPPARGHAGDHGPVRARGGAAAHGDRTVHPLLRERHHRPHAPRPPRPRPEDAGTTGSLARGLPTIAQRVIDELGAAETVVGYGLSEASPNVAQSAWWEDREIRVSGRMLPQPGVTVRIRDRETGEDLRPARSARSRCAAGTSCSATSACPRRRPRRSRRTDGCPRATSAGSEPTAASNSADGPRT